MSTIKMNAVGSAKAIEVSPEVFGQTYNEGLVHQAVVAYLANARSGTVGKKSRSDVRGGGAKPWRQKGTGRARAGTIRSPLWKGGGKTFAPKEFNWTHKINRKMHKKSMQCILSEMIRLDRLKVFKDLSIESHKTKDFLAAIKGWKLEGKTLLIVDNVDEKIYLSTRNLTDVDVIDCSMVNPYMFLCYENVLVDEVSVQKLEEVLK